MPCARHGPKQGYFKAISVEEKPGPDGGFNFVFDWTANSKTVNEDTTFEFAPPVYSGWARCNNLCCDSACSASEPFMFAGKLDEMCHFMSVL